MSTAAPLDLCLCQEGNCEEQIEAEDRDTGTNHDKALILGVQAKCVQNMGHERTKTRHKRGRYSTLLLLHGNFLKYLCLLLAVSNFLFICELFKTNLKFIVVLQK